MSAQDMFRARLIYNSFMLKIGIGFGNQWRTVKNSVSLYRCHARITPLFLKIDIFVYVAVAAG